MPSCEQCGTHTGTHWPNCSHYMGPRPKTLDSPISERTNGEKNSYLQGYEAAIRSVEEHGIDFAKQTLAIVKDIL